jgi:hypothetical protein
MKAKFLGGPLHNKTRPTNLDICLEPVVYKKKYVYTYYGNLDFEILIYLLNGQKIDKYIKAVKRIKKTWSRQSIKKQSITT